MAWRFLGWKFLDWKFLVTFSVSILGVVVPVVWQSDPSSKGMELRLNSITSLEPASQIHDLQLVLDGKKLESPYSSTVELINTGSKAVLSKDFDKPIEIHVEDEAKVITARVTGTVPSDIPVQLSTTDNTVQISPHLSNSGDSVSINIITSGKKPAYSVRARIAGIPHVTYTDLTQPKSPYMRYLKPAVQGLCAWALFCLNIVFLVAWLSPQAFGIPRVLSFFVAATSYISGAQLLVLMVEGFELQNRWGVLASILVVAVLMGMVLATRLTLRWDGMPSKPNKTPGRLGPFKWP
ncbi:hypothetical protein KVQ82_28825 [Pseudomonas sp. AO-1]|uniref:hypothetical protein n=1 Tax=Pseudomonas sp. AO-1 TaxID=2855434 RepID=UPI001C76386A|nr:hypothetical protein [Pseudomonas sp. AO-1]QXZ14020.1 hypothetical protein KVQ82_28825 [Pseudomonas sp. AO-1]